MPYVLLCCLVVNACSKQALTCSLGWSMVAVAEFGVACPARLVSEQGSKGSRIGRGPRGIVFHKPRPCFVRSDRSARILHTVCLPPPRGLAGWLAQSRFQKRRVGLSPWTGTLGTATSHRLNFLSTPSGLRMKMLTAQQGSICDRHKVESVWQQYRALHRSISGDGRASRPISCDVFLFLVCACRD